MTNQELNVHTISKDVEGATKPLKYSFQKRKGITMSLK
jgi:hypothetical protein